MSQLVVSSGRKVFDMSAEQDKPSNYDELSDSFAKSAKMAKKARIAEYNRKMEIIREREREHFKNTVLPANGILSPSSQS